MGCGCGREQGLKGGNGSDDQRCYNEVGMISADSEVGMTSLLEKRDYGDT